MKTVTVEWLHLDEDGMTCDRCAGTGEEVRAAVRSLNSECASRGVSIAYRERKLSTAQIAKSNLILIDGSPIEDILPDAAASQSCCPSCGEITGRKESCRTIVQLGEVYETIPRKLIRAAVCRIAQCC